MVAGDGEMLGAAAPAQVEAACGVPAIESRIRHAAGISRKTGAFEAVDDEDLAFRFAAWVLTVDQDLNVGLGAIDNGFDRPTLLDERTAPEVARHGGEVRVAEEWMERVQNTIVRGERCRIEAGC